MVMGHVGIQPDNVGLVAADDRTRAKHWFKFREEAKGEGKKKGRGREGVAQGPAHARAGSAIISLKPGW